MIVNILKTNSILKGTLKDSGDGVKSKVRLRSHVICPCAFARPLQKQNMDIASASQKTDQIKVVTGVPEVVFANWREALHGSGIPRHVRTSYEYGIGRFLATTHVMKKPGLGVRSPFDSL